MIVLVLSIFLGVDEPVVLLQALLRVALERKIAGSVLFLGMVGEVLL